MTLTTQEGKLNCLVHLKTCKSSDEDEIIAFSMISFRLNCLLKPKNKYKYCKTVFYFIDVLKRRNTSYFPSNTISASQHGRETLCILHLPVANCSIVPNHWRHFCIQDMRLLVLGCLSCLITPHVYRSEIIPT